MTEEAKRGPGRPKKEGVTTAPIRLRYDTWQGEDRYRAGEVIDVEIEMAKRLLSEGKAERADPMPGE